MNTGLGGVDYPKLGIPTPKEHVENYARHCGMDGSHLNSRMPLYLAFGCHRGCAIIQGVYKRYLQGIGSWINVEKTNIESVLLDSKSAR